MDTLHTIYGLDPALVFVIKLATVIVVGLATTVILGRVVRGCMKKSERIDNAIIKFVVNAVRVTCLIIIVAIILQMFGVNMSTVVAILGAAGAAIALALKDSLANIAGGFMIIITHPFSKGDLISVNGDRGRVEDIDLFLTTLKTPDLRTVTIPNGKINTSVVYNESNQQLRRVDCSFTVSYDSDVDRAKEIIREVCRKGRLISMEKEPWIGVCQHRDSGLEIECLAYCMEGDQWEAKYYLYEEVKKEFDLAGIEIPYPHMTVELEK